MLVMTVALSMTVCNMWWSWRKATTSTLQHQIVVNKCVSMCKDVHSAVVVKTII